MQLFCLVVATLVLAANGEYFNFDGRPEGINIARFKQVTASKPSGESPSKAVDGSGAVRFGPTGRCYRSAGDEGGWIRIDLGKTETIHAIEIFTSDHDPGTATYAARRNGDRDLEVRIGDDKNFENNPVCAKFGDPFVPRREVAYCERVLCGRYISIQRTTPNTGVFHVCEFLAWYKEGTTCEEPTTPKPTTPEPTTPKPTTPKPTTPKPTTPKPTTPKPTTPKPTTPKPTTPKPTTPKPTTPKPTTPKPTTPKPTTPKPTTPKPTTPKPTTPKPTTPKAPIDPCPLPREVGSCDKKVKRYFFKPEKAKCIAFDACADVEDANNFGSQDDCETTCSAWMIPPECLLKPDVGTGSGQTIKYYFDTKTWACKKLKYTGSGGNQNRFESKDDCAEYCKNKDL